MYTLPHTKSSWLGLMHFPEDLKMRAWKLCCSALFTRSQHTYDQKYTQQKSIWKK